MTLFYLEVEDDTLEKVMEILTPKGVFIWSLKRIKNSISLQGINCTKILYVNNNEAKFGFMTYYLLHADSL